MFGNTDFTSAHASTRVTDRRMAAQDGSIESRKIGSALKKRQINNIRSLYRFRILLLE